MLASSCPGAQDPYHNQACASIVRLRKVVQELQRIISAFGLDCALLNVNLANFHDKMLKRRAGSHQGLLNRRN